MKHVGGYEANEIVVLPCGDRMSIEKIFHSVSSMYPPQLKFTTIFSVLLRICHDRPHTNIDCIARTVGQQNDIRV
jgi:hypothetical protein